MKLYVLYDILFEVYRKKEVYDGSDAVFDICAKKFEPKVSNCQMWTQPMKDLSR